MGPYWLLNWDPIMSRGVNTSDCQKQKFLNKVSVQAKKCIKKSPGKKKVHVRTVQWNIVKMMFTKYEFNWKTKGSYVE